MSEAVDLDALFSPANHADTGVDAFLAEFSTPQDPNAAALAAQKEKKADAPLSRKKQRPPAWFIPLPRTHFKFISKANLSAIMRDKMHLVQKHATLTDHFYFNHWVAKSKKRSLLYRMHRLASMAKLSKVALAQIQAQQDAGLQDLGLDHIQEHIEQREEELDLEAKMKEEQNKDNGDKKEDKESKGLKALGRIIKHSTRHGRGITTWGSQKEETLEDVPDILPANAPARQQGSFDRDQNAVSRRFIEQGFEIIIKAQDDVLMLDSLPKLPLIPPSDPNTTYKLRVDTQDVQLSDVLQLRTQRDDQNPYLLDSTNPQSLFFGATNPATGLPFSALPQSNNQEDEQHQQQQQSNQTPTSSILTEALTYPQLLTLHTKLRNSLHRLMDEFFELLDVQYTLQHVFSTASNINNNNPQDISLELLTLSPIQDITIEFQLPLRTPLNQLPLLLPHLQIDIAAVISVLDNSRWTVFTGFDDSFIKLLLPVPRTLVLFSKAIQLSQQGQLPHLNRLIGFVLDLLPDFMSMDRLSMTNQMATIPMTQTQYQLQTPSGPKDDEKKKNKKAAADAANKSNGKKIDPDQPQGEEQTSGLQLVNPDTDKTDADVDETQETKPIEPIPTAPQNSNIAIPFCLFNSRYVPYIPTTKSATGKSTISDANNALAQAVSSAIQSAPSIVVQRSCDQIHSFFTFLLDLPFQHSFPYTQPPSDQDTPEFNQRRKEFELGGFNPYLEQVGIFFHLLRDGLFGPIFKSFFLVMNQIQSKIPTMEGVQIQLMGEITQLTRYKDLFVTAYGRGVQQFIRSISTKTSLDEIKSIPVPLAPTSALLNKVLEDFSIIIGPEVLETGAIDSDPVLELLGITKDTLNGYTTPQQLIQILQQQLSATVRVTFEKFQMKQHKETLELKQAEEQTYLVDMASHRTTQLRITEKIILSVLVPLTSIMPPPIPPPPGTIVDSATQDLLQQQQRPNLGLPQELLRENLLWWLFLGLTTSDELLVGLQGNITTSNIFTRDYLFKSGGPESLWNVFFNTDSTALQTIANRVRSRRHRFDNKYSEALSKYRTLPEEFRNVRFGQTGRQQGRGGDLKTKQKIGQQTKALFHAAMQRYRVGLENATHFNAREVNRIEDQVNIIRNDFLSPQVSLPTSMRLFIEDLKAQNAIKKTLYQNNQHTSTVDTIVSTLTLFALYLPPNDLQFPCLSIICPILFFWLHVQKSIYIDYAKLSSQQEQIMPWFTFLSALPYFQHFQQLIPRQEFERVHRQTDEVCNMYRFLADQDSQYQNFQQAHYFHFTQELRGIQSQGEDNLQKQHFPQMAKPAGAAAGDDAVGGTPKKTGAPLQGQWAQRQQEQQQQQQTQQTQPPGQGPRQYNNNNKPNYQPRDGQQQQQQQRPYQQRDGQQQQQQRPYQQRDGQLQQQRPYQQRDGQLQQQRPYQPRDGQQQGQKPYQQRDNQNKGPKNNLPPTAISATPVSAQPVKPKPE